MLIRFRALHDGETIFIDADFITALTPVPRNSVGAAAQSGVQEYEPDAVRIWVSGNGAFDVRFEGTIAQCSDDIDTYKERSAAEV